MGCSLFGGLVRGETKGQEEVVSERHPYTQGEKHPATQEEELQKNRDRLSKECLPAHQHRALTVEKIISHVRGLRGRSTAAMCVL